MSWDFLNFKQPGWDPLTVPAVIIGNKSLVPVTTGDILNIVKQTQNQDLLKGLSNITLESLKGGINANVNVTYQPTQGKDKTNVDAIKKTIAERLKTLGTKKTVAATKQINTGGAVTRAAGQGLLTMGIDPLNNLQLQLQQQQRQAPKLKVGKKVQQTVNQLFDLLGEGAVANRDAEVTATDGKKVRAKQMVAKLFAAQNIGKKPVLGIKQFDKLPLQIRSAYPQQQGGVLVTAKNKPIIYKPRDYAKAQELMKTQIGADYGGNIVKGLFGLANEVFLQAGFQKMGPTGKGKLPLYIGRWLDQKTNMVKIPPKNKMVTNPTVWKDKFNQSVYNMAYKWNTFVKSAQQVKNLIDNKTYWKDIVKSKVNANSLAVIRKRQLFNLLKSIANGNAFYQELKSDQQAQLLKLIKAWDYPKVARFLQIRGTEKANSNQFMTPAVKRVAEYWSKFSQNALKSYARFQIMSKMKPGSVMSKEQYKKAVIGLLNDIPPQVAATAPASPFRTGGGGFRKVFMNKIKKANFQPQILNRIQTAIEKQEQQQPQLTRQQILDQLKGLDDEDTQQLSFQNQMGMPENEMMNRTGVMA